MGLSFLTSGEARHLSVAVRWGDYTTGETEGRDGKTLPTWQRTPREETVDLPLTGAAEPVVRDVPGSDGLQLFAVERKVVAEDLKELIPPGTRSVSSFLVNRREPLDDQPDRSFAFQTELEVHASSPFVPRPDPRGVLAARQRRQRYLVPRGVVVEPEVRGERAPGRLSKEEPTDVDSRSS